MIYFEDFTDEELKCRLIEAKGILKKSTNQKEKIETEIKRRERSKFPTYLCTSNAPHSVHSPLLVLGIEFDKLNFDELPRRVHIGRSQYKFVSRVGK